MYEPPRQEDAPGCRDTLVLTRAVFAVILLPVLALIVLLGVLGGALFLFSIHPALALLPVAAIVVAIFLFAQWERRNIRPPDA